MGLRADALVCVCGGRTGCGGGGGRGSEVGNRGAGGCGRPAWVSVDPQLRVGLVAGYRAHPEVSPGARVVGGWEPGFCSLSAGSLGGGLPVLELSRLGGGPRLTQQCLGAGWESLILPGNDGGPCPCVSDIYRLPPPPTPAGCNPLSRTSPHTVEAPSS